jgi:serine/threonine protein kinase/tetratricopeptide (TPR) repeat protein
MCSKCSTPFGVDRSALVEEGETLAFDPTDEAATILDPQATEAHPAAALTAGIGGTGWSVPIQRLGSQDPNIPLEPGMLLGERYEILKRLGEGGMGAVYKARDTELERMVALKVIRPELAGHPDILRRFKQELILARQVTHKNVVRIFDLVTAGGRKFITMDYIEGQDLKGILTERGRLPPAEAVPIVQQICHGLEAAHIENVVHRDLKPQNIMVDAAGRVFLMDFGLARSMEQAGLTRTGVLLGTPDYMSPEQARAEKVDARSDLFSLGIIFFEMLTGQLPFQADTLMAKLLQRTQQRAAPAASVYPSIPQSLSDVVSKCLETDVTKRYQNAREILDDLSAGTTIIGASVAPAGASTAGLPPVSIADLGPGSQFGPRYRIDSVIGEGGMGKVYKAYDSDLERTVALKLVRQELASAPSSMQRFKQELLLASRISHRNILRIHDLGDVEGIKFISMAYVQGRDLHEVIRQCGRLPVERAVNIAKQLAGALEAAHSEGVVHRDLKPRNVLIDVDDHVYVSDFGLAKSLDSEASTMTRAGEVLGTPRYMSPEQAESKPADHRSDIYSLGVILYEMFTGGTPFTGESSLQVMFQHVQQQPKDPRTLNPELPEYLAKITLKCLEKNPALRYQNAGEILQDLDSGRPPTRIVRLRIAETGYPKWLFASMAVVIVLGGSLVIRPVRELVLGRTSITIRARTHASTANEKFLALLPLRVTDPALKPEAGGVVDALFTKLYQMKNVHLATQAEVEKVNPGDSPVKIARQLGVKQIVQGTVQSAGDKINIVLTLTDASGRLLWTKEFRGVRQDLLTIEDQTFNQLSEALNLRPSSEDLARSTSHPTENIAAYESYLKGRDIMRGKWDVKRVQSAIDLYDQAINKDPSFALAYAGLADASLDMYDWKKDTAWSQKALAAAQHAQTLNDDLPEVHFALGNVYEATGKTTEAIVELKRALELAPSSDEGYRRLANAYLSARQKDEALKAFQQAIDTNPYYWLNYNHLGKAYFQLGENQKALDAFQRVVQLAPESVLGYENLAVTNFQMGTWNEAASNFEKALKIEPSAHLYSNLGTVYFYLNRHADATHMFEKAVEMSPNDYLAVGNLADGYRWSGEKDKAQDAYSRAIGLAYKALQVNPKDATAMGFLGVDYTKNGDSRKGLDFIRRARSIDPNDTQLIYFEAVIDALAGQQPEALKNLREALQKGYSTEMAKVDPDLKTLEGNPELGKLLAEFARKAN